MLVLALELVAGVADDLIVSCRRDDPPETALLEGRSVRIVFDERGGGPLAGVETALAAAKHDLAVVVPVDMPGLTPMLLTALVEAALSQPEAQGAVFVTSSGPAAFPGAYRRSILPQVVKQLDAGAFRVHEMLRGLDLVSVSPPSGAEVGESAFLNVNTQADLDRAKRVSGRP
jgi:molybdopterin-guanine dinucleotide biosynthesis protein A